MTEISKNFDSCVEGYDAYAAPQSLLANALAELIPNGERHGYALEFGAGTGLFTRRLQPWSGPYLATDAAPRMVAAGIERCPYVAWKQHDATKPQGLGLADWVLACNVLQWLEKPAEVLAAWRNELKPRGHLALAVFVKGTLEELAEVLPETSSLNWRTETEWAELVRHAGFTLEREENWRHVEIYPGALQFLRTIHDMGLAPLRLAGPGRGRTAGKEDDRKFALPGGVHATWQAWLIRAARA